MLDPRYEISLQARGRCFRGLVKTCGECDTLPDSYIIPESKIKKLQESPFSSNNFSDVWPGVYEEDKFVAIKVMRYYESDDIQTVKKVRHLEPFPHVNQS